METRRLGAAVVPDLLTGRIQVSLGDMVALVPYIKSGKLRAIAVTSKRRSALLPDVPTLDEAGIKGYSAVAWYGMFAPAGTPRSIVQKPNVEIVRSLYASDVIKQFTALGAEPVGSTPEEFQSFILSEMARWARVIHDAGLHMK